VGDRPVYYESDAGGTWHAARIYQREKLLAGNRISGPAIIDEISATTVLYPGDRVTVHSSGNLIQEVM
jgi:N-methylhydantoinase A